jgi:replicative DNA helicase
MEKVEVLVVRNLFYNEKFSRKVIPFIKKDYFEDQSNRILFEEISSFIVKYDELPSKEAVAIEVENRSDLNESSYKEVSKVLSYLEKEAADFDWLIDTTEKWCRDRAIYLALMESIAVADGSDEKRGRDAIPSILSDALAVSFDNHIGHDYLLDYQERYDLYHRKEEKIPFDLEYLNKITKGGIPNKTLNIALAGTGVGKSLFMCHVASSCHARQERTLHYM